MLLFSGAVFYEKGGKLNEEKSSIIHGCIDGRIVIDRKLCVSSVHRRNAGRK